MFRPRLIPVLLVHRGRLVKSLRFRDFEYVGDPINAVRLFDDFGADELLLLDIGPDREQGRGMLDLLCRIRGFVTTPVAVGGGVGDAGRIRTLINAGAEKVVLSTHAVERPDLVAEAAQEFGSSTIAVCLDVGRDRAGTARIWTRNGAVRTDHPPVKFAELIASKGAGEIVLQSIERDGTMAGYDLPLVRAVSAAVSVPVVAAGGAGSIGHMREAHEAGASAVAAGSAFVYFKKRGAVLISYPSPDLRGL